MKLVDTSIWIEFLRKKGDPAIKHRLAQLIAVDQAAYACPVRFELLAGALPQELAALETALSFAHRIELRAETWDLAGVEFRRLKEQGKTVPTSDLLIAIAAARENMPVVCRDNHFEIVAQHAKLPNLVVETW